MELSTEDRKCLTVWVKGDRIVGNQQAADFSFPEERKIVGYGSPLLRI